MCLIFIKERKMKFTKIALASMVLGGSLLLSACGGGGGGSGLSLNGTAAVGTPVVGTVVATCKIGTGTSVSNLDSGSYNAYIDGGAGPCLLKITPANGTAVMYSITSGSGASQTANITPMTGFLVSYLRGLQGTAANSSPEDWFKLPTTAILLGDTEALNKRIVDGFIPAMRTLVPGLSLSTVDFLSTAFIANPFSSLTDKDLETLQKAQLESAGNTFAAALALKAKDAAPLTVAATGGSGSN
jgi:hypothetical protein